MHFKLLVFSLFGVLALARNNTNNNNNTLSTVMNNWMECLSPCLSDLDQNKKCLDGSSLDCPCVDKVADCLCQGQDKTACLAGYCEKYGDGTDLGKLCAKWNKHSSSEPEPSATKASEHTSSAKVAATTGALAIQVAAASVFVSLYVAVGGLGRAITMVGAMAVAVAVLMI